MPSRYQGRIVALATKHAKERALVWPLHRGLGLSLTVPPGLDTDALGTFTGEIAREGTPAQVIRRKARLGMAATGPDEAASFAHRVSFPSHALIVRPAGDPASGLIHKGVSDHETLRRAVREAIDASPNRAARVETDMRAHFNPTRMRVIRRLGAKLARRLRTLCPECACPGFGKTGAEPGLACEDWGEPTGLILREVQGCPRCRAQRLSPRPDGRASASASAQPCSFCNP